MIINTAKMAALLGVSRQTISKWCTLISIDSKDLKDRSYDTRETAMFQLWACNYMRTNSPQSATALEIVIGLKNHRQSRFMIYRIDHKTFHYCDAISDPESLDCFSIVILDVVRLHESFLRWRDNAMSILSKDQPGRFL